MTRAQQIIQILEETVERTALVHPDHADNLEKRLKDKKIDHHRHKQPVLMGGFPYIGFGIRSEAWQPFQSCCQECQNSSSSPNPVCAGTASGSGFAGGGAAGGYSGAGGSSVAAT